MSKIAPNNTIIELENVSFSYTSEETIIQDISLEVHKGDYVGITGPNGGGKSTLMKLMLGLNKPTRGTVKLFGTKIHKFKDWYKIGYVPQKSQVDMNFPVTVEELVAMGRYGKRGVFYFPTEEDKEKTREALKQVGMLSYKDRQLNDLSGGQQQRVFIARALASEPEVIFLDEPTVGVDVKTKKQFYALLRKLNRDLQLTLVFVSHDIDIVAHESTEIAYINRTLDFYGAPKDFLDGVHFHELTGGKEEVHHA